MISALCLIYSLAFVKMLFGISLQGKSSWNFCLLALTLNKWASNNVNLTPMMFDVYQNEKE